METVKIINPRQAFLYVKNGVNPINIEAGYNERLVFVFNKEETRKVYDLWYKHELN